MQGLQGLDWLKLVRKVWSSRILILKLCGIGATIGIVIASGTPKSYTANTLVAHEGTRSRSFSSISALTDMADDMNSSITNERDALYPSLYPAIVNSTPFLLKLFDVKVNTQKDSTTLTLVKYLKEYQKVPWWSVVTSAPSRMMGWCMSQFRAKPKEEKVEKGIEINPTPCRLTREEIGIAGAIASCISIEIDKKKRTIRIDVTMQDPQVAATLADTVQARLKAYMTEYRTSKARNILKYHQKLCKEAEMEYYAAQDKYTRYADANRNLVLFTSRAELSRLKNEMNLAYSTYNQTEVLVQAAKARVDKKTPVYTVIQPVTVPLSSSKPRWMLILTGWTLLGGITGIGWVLFAKEFLKRIRKTN